MLEVALQEAGLLLAGLVPSGGCWGVAWDQEQAAPLPATAGTLKVPSEGSEKDESSRLERDF